MKKLAISFITYNRAKHIREDLSVIVQPTKEKEIDIYIYDGSTNMQTEHVVKEYVQKGYDHIHYFHTDEKVSASDSLTQRMISAFQAPDAEYVWLCGDKFVIRPEHYAEILSYIDKSYDVITIYGYPLRGTRKFDNPHRFAYYAIVPITHLGSTIIKKKLIESFNISEARKENAPFGVQLSYLRAIANIESFKGVVIDKGTQTSIISRYKTRSGSTSYMWFSWVHDWYRFIELLPSAYESIRKELYNKPDLQMGFFSIKELLRQRLEGQFDCKKYWEYRNYVKKVIVAPSICVLCIAILPQSAAKWLYSICDIKK